MGTHAIDRTETDRVRRIWERDAAVYDRAMTRLERLFFAGGREWVCSKAKGAVLEIAIGTGRNLAFYPSGQHVTGIDLSRSTLALASQRAQEVGAAVRLCEADAQELPFADASFDSVVCTLALCSVPDDGRAVAEVRRVLRPGGRFLLLEHVRSPILPVRVLERIVESITFRRDHDHLTREPLLPLRAEAFSIELLERSKLGIVERVVAVRSAS